MASGADYRKRLDEDGPDLMNHNDVNQTCWGKHAKWKKCLWCSCLTILIILSVQVLFVPHLLRNMIHDGLVDALVITSDSSSGFDSWSNNTGR